MSDNVQLEQICSLVDDLVIQHSGWTGEAGGAMHKAYLAASDRLRGRRDVLWKEQGVCVNCGHSSNAAFDESSPKP